jgi:hypothetical protein
MWEILLHAIEAGAFVTVLASLVNLAGAITRDGYRNN